MSKKPRFGYEVIGTFSELPNFIERPLCSVCVVAPVTQAKLSATVAEYLLPPVIQSAIVLGKRVSGYLRLLSSAEEKAIERAQLQHGELLTALTDFRALYSGSPRADRTLLGHSRQHSQIVSLLSAYTEDGQIVPQLRTRPSYTPRFGGAREDVLEQAHWLYRTQRGLTLRDLSDFRRRSYGVDSDRETLRATLLAGGWAEDGDDWLPAGEYYTGSLWPRYDRATARAAAGDPVATSQAARLLTAIAPVTLSAIEPDPRLPWIPMTILRVWIELFTGGPCPELERRDYYLIPKGVSLLALIKRESIALSLATVIGFLNIDYSVFEIPKPPKEIDLQTGKPEEDSEAQARARLGYEGKALASWRSYLDETPSAANTVVEAYNRTYRGYVEPTYNDPYTYPSRWGSQVTLRPHQEAGAARLLAHNGGLLAFDVGVGKTYTGIATLAKLREQGKARRPVVVVPNSLLFQWLKQIQVALPDYRVLIIGAERYIGRSGALTSRTDTPEERAAKWRMFQAGGADVVLISYTTFARAVVRSESRVSFIYSSPPMLRLFGVEARKAEADATEDKSKGKKKPRKASKATLDRLFAQPEHKGMSQADLESMAEAIALESERVREADRQALRTLLSTLSTYTEREQAVLKNRIERWAFAQPLESDPGVVWEDLGIDALFLDEAQNMKNLWPYLRGDGGKPPKYLGAIDRPSQRALEFAIRAYLVRRKNGGSGVFLLSATPAKNSPIEYFSLLSLVDGEAWTKLGITDSGIFVTRYLKIERKRVLDTDLTQTTREVVVGFVNIPELRDAINRLSEFRTAEEVGLKLPKTDVYTIKVPMDEEQSQSHRRLIALYRENIADRSAGARNAALGALMKLVQVSIHAELLTPPSLKDGWTRSNWNQVRNPSSPKFERCGNEIVNKQRCGHLVFVETVAAHYWLREVLVKKGVARERIAILNAEEAPTPLRRQVIAESFNGVPAILDAEGHVEMEAVLPLYDVVIANSVAYEGIDLHIRTCMVHHLDLPYEPATLQQRNGRAVRQGNTQAVIGIYYYISVGSIDAARLTIILGKLTWMKDILQSSDRETNNPAAGSELSNDDLVSFLYSDADLPTLKAEIAKRQEEEDRRVARRRAWQLTKRIAETSGHPPKGPVELNQEEYATRELVRQLKEIPTRTWPWHSTLLKYLLDGYALTLLDLRYRTDESGETAEQAGEEGIVTVPLWERAVFVSATEPIQFQVGVARADYVSIRMAQSIEWVRINSLLLNSSPLPQHVALHRALRKASPEQYDQQRWPTTVDRLGIEQRLLEALPWLADKGLAALAMTHAPETWRQQVWDTWGAKILERLPNNQRVPLAMGPLFGNAGTAGQQPLPWTEQGHRQFVERAKGTPNKWTELNALSESWFERPFPKGVLGKAEESMTVNAATPKGMVTTAATWSSRGLAVAVMTPAMLPDGWTQGYSVTHVASGLSVGSAIASGERAQRFAEWLLTLGIDFTQPKVVTRELTLPVIEKLVEWLASQPFLVSVEEIQAKFQELR
ncbi:MAG: hypothetical protein IPL15_10765 [Comamonadaceae bacterium]|uniref:SNF2-related protein n=1 Tax=Candidatus Skiveiella danica TaxID=3386177 RepID=UPI00390A30D7|nr:hypothetical protein [Comamonadaceae bacterium]